MNREELLDAVARYITDVTRQQVVRVALDGVDAAGKTAIANELAERLQRLGRPVIRAGIDRFHDPRSIRLVIDNNDASRPMLVATRQKQLNLR